MANKRNSKQNMKQIYLIRRVVAVLIIILIIVGIFTRCSNKKETEEDNTNQNLNQTQFEDNQVTQPNIVNGITDDNNLNEEPTEPETESGDEEIIPEVIANNLNNIQNEYDEHANVEYKHDDNAFYFNFKGDTRNIVTDRDEDDYKEAFDTFWEEFKYDLTKTSETLAETVEPGLELHVVDPKDDRSTILLIKDGSTLFDSTEI